MPKLTHVECERAIEMLQTNVTPSVAVKQFRWHVRTVGRPKNRFQQTWITSDRPCPGRARVLTRRQDHQDVAFVQSILSGDSHS